MTEAGAVVFFTDQRLCWQHSVGCLLMSHCFKSLIFYPSTRFSVSTALHWISVMQIKSNIWQWPPKNATRECSLEFFHLFHPFNCNAISCCCWRVTSFWQLKFLVVTETSQISPSTFLLCLRFGFSWPLCAFTNFIYLIDWNALYIWHKVWHM